MEKDMSFILISFAILLWLISIYLGFVAYKDYRKIIISNQVVGFAQIMKISTLFVVAATLLFFGIIITSSITDENYSWSVVKVLEAVIVSIIPGAVTMLGSIYQIFSTTKYRDILIKYLKNRNKS
jgi:hypothetical protein